MQPMVAYLADGKLFLKRPGQRADPVESRFGEEMVDQALRSREKNEWKTRSQTGQVMSGGMLWGGNPAEPAARRIHISGITRGEKSGTLLYALDTDTVGGLFRYDIRENLEQRLFHQNRFRIRHLSRHSELQTVAFSMRSEDGVADIAVMDYAGKDLHVVTEGDSLDESPSWVPGETAKLLFQSAGIGRDQAGQVAGIGPYAIQMLDLDRGELTTLLEETKKDFLLPRMAADGSLFFIRRPYQPARAPGAWPLVRDAVLIPVRLLFAVFGFLNFFSLMWSGKPLTTAGGPSREAPSPRYLMLWGKLIDAEKAARAAKGEPAALVPKDWELVRRPADGAEEVMAQGVVSFDLCEDGSVVYTNGAAVYHISRDGRRDEICRGKMIEHVIAAG
jgi:hypothetical protein